MIRNLGHPPDSEYSCGHLAKSIRDRNDALSIDANGIAFRSHVSARMKIGMIPVCCFSSKSNGTVKPAIDTNLDLLNQKRCLTMATCGSLQVEGIFPAHAKKYTTALCQTAPVIPL